MKTKKRLLMFCGLVCALLLSVSLCIGVMFAGTDPELTTSSNLEASYTLGAELEIPQGTIKVGESTVDAETVVVFPSGAAYKTTVTVLSEEGKYTVQYRANVAGKLYVVEKTFVASSSLYGHSSGTTIKYGTYDAASHNAKGFSPTGGEVTGLQVSLAGGDTLRYNKVIDLNALTKDDQIIKFAITPAEIGTADTSEMFMYLTDAYDPENVITIKIRQPDPITGYSNIYMSAAAPGQSLTGKEWNSGSLHVGGNYGAPFRANFAGFFPGDPTGKPSPYLSTIQENTVSFSMNYAERELHCTIRPASETSTVVADFDNSAYFGKLWEGFTTGEVFVSLTSSSPVNFVLTEVAGRDSIEDMSFGEREKPAITVDFGDYTETTMPVAVVGEKYPLFSASGRSPYSGSLPVEARVYGNYYASNRYELLVKDGTFTPTTPGTYFIAYEARDTFGQVGTKVIPITALATYPEMIVERGDLEEPVNAGIAGHPVEVAYPTVSNPVGNPSVVATYKVGEEAPVVIEDGSFIPTKAGTYTVTLTATDFVRRVKSVSYDVVVEAGTKPVFEKEPYLPVAFISGCEYVLPQIGAYNFTDGSGDAVAVKVTATSTTSESLIRGGKFTPVAMESGEMITIKYEAAIGETEESKVVWSQDVPVVVPFDDEGSLRLERLLIKEGNVGAIVAGDDYTTISFGEGYSSVIWANSLLASGFNMEFSSADVENNYSGVSIGLIDAENPEQVVVITYERSAKGALVYFNYDKSDTRIASQFFTKTSDIFGLTYNAEEKTIKFDPFSNETFMITETLYGEEFTGFGSGRVYVTFTMEGVTAPTKMNLNSLATQKINNIARDRIGPRIAISGSYGGTVQLGDVVALNPAMAADVVDPSAEVTLTVRNPDNSYAVSNEGVLLKEVDGTMAYTLTITQNGRYRVAYNSVDMNGAKALAFNYVINVPDTEKPVIEVEKAIAETGKVGKAVAISKYTVTDNISESEEIVSGVMVVTSNGNWVMIDLEKNQGFTPDRAGKYIVRYFAYDVEGNFVVIDYVVMVTE